MESGSTSLQIARETIRHGKSRPMGEVPSGYRGAGGTAVSNRWMASSFIMLSRAIRRTASGECPRAGARNVRSYHEFEAGGRSRLQMTASIISLSQHLKISFRFDSVASPRAESKQ